MAVKMFRIVSNVVPKLVQRNFCYFRMLPLNECTRTCATLYTRKSILHATLRRQAHGYYSLLDEDHASAEAGADGFIRIWR